MEIPDLGPFFSALEWAKALAALVGLADSVDQKVDRLISAPYNSALRSLREAKTSESQKEHLLREAQSNFRNALSLELDGRLAIAYIGLAFCQYHLGDKINARKTLEEFSRHPFGKKVRLWTYYAVMHVPVVIQTNPYLLVFIGFPWWVWNKLTKGSAAEKAEYLIRRITKLSDEQAAIHLQKLAINHLKRCPSLK
jgi:hypothetical protein